MRRVAGIVIFWPDHELLLQRVAALARSNEHVVIVANSPLSQAERASLLALAPGSGTIEIVEAPENVGLGRAYNLIAQCALARGADAVLVSDQDSDIEPAVVEELAACMSALKAAGHNPAVVGTRPVAPNGSQSEFKETRLFKRRAETSAPNAQAADFTISSGSLISLAAYGSVGSFREDFFIDAIDIEWCFRAWSAGFSCWTATEAPMPHRLGRGAIEIPLIKWKLTRQPPTRLYTYVRNQIHMLALRHVPMRWKLKVLPHMAFQAAAYAARADEKRASIAAMGRGLRDGIKRARAEFRSNSRAVTDDSVRAPPERS